MTAFASRWFFLVLAVLGAVAAIIPFGYATKRQITRIDFDKALAVWQARGLEDYDLRIRHEGSEGKSESLVRIRGGQAREVVSNGEFVDARVGGLTVDGILAKLEALLGAKADADYLVADFHPILGYPVRLVWRPRAGSREEWVLKLDDVQGR